MKIRYLSRLGGILLGTTMAVACGPQEETDVIQLDAVGANPTAGEFRIRNYQGGFLIDINGDAAADLYEVYRDAGIFRRVTSGSRILYRGQFSACVEDGGTPFCQLYVARTGQATGFEFTMHSGRSPFGTGELHAGLANAAGGDASDAQSQSRRFYCESDRSGVWCGLRTPNSSSGDASLVLRLAGLDDLGPDYVYEGWLITSNGAVTSGRFDLNSSDETINFPVDEATARDSSLFVLTIEPAVGDDPAPADTHVVAGGFDSGLAILDINHPAALGTNFANASGGFILGVPTDPNAPSYDQGIWFLDPATGPGASLDLPTLPNGWAYEGWVVTANGPVSTGRFLEAEGADDDGAGPAAGPAGAPPFPGQDFVNPPTNLIGTTVVISVEPEPDNSPAPFALKPLIGGAADAGGGVLQRLENRAAGSNPRGAAILLDADGQLILP